MALIKNKITERDYRTAKQTRNPEVRQRFLDSIPLGEDRRFVQGIEYQRLQYDALMSYAQKKISVFYESFLLSFTDFMSTLMVHELNHARQDFFKRQEIEAMPSRGQYNFRHGKSVRYIDALIEIPPNVDQIFNKELKLSDSGKDHATSDLHTNLWIVNYLAPDNWKVDLSKILSPSPFDDAVRELYSID